MITRTKSAAILFSTLLSFNMNDASHAQGAGVYSTGSVVANMTPISGAGSAISTMPPSPVATPQAQAHALRIYPNLGKADSYFNREFLSRVKRAQAQSPHIFSIESWPSILANEVASTAFPPTPVSTQSQLPGRQLLPSSAEWQFLKVYREGDDIIVPQAKATVFGWDSALSVRDPNDNGKCASGRGTMQNPGLLGCALPVSQSRRSTSGSAFAKLPALPWFTSVIVTYKGRSITVELIDNGPSAPGVGDSTRAGIDLTPAACLALGIPIEDIRNNRANFDVSYRVPGAAKQGAWFASNSASRNGAGNDAGRFELAMR